MDYGALEIEIANHLAGKLSPHGFEAIPLPETPAEFSKPFAVGRATVMFAGEKAVPNQSTGHVSQHVTVAFSCGVQSRLLRGDQGVPKLADLVKLYLVGYEPQD